MLAAVALVVVLVLVFLARLRVLASQVGSFECAYRPDGAQRWMSGIATFGDDALEWHRLISLAPRARMQWRREDLEVGPARPRGADGRVIEVGCRVRGRELELAMLEDSHSALVAWLESAAPSQPTLF